MTHILHKLIISSTAETVYTAITTQEGIQNWWTIDTRMKPEVGTIAEFTFGDRYQNKMKIVDLQLNKRVEWLCLEADQEWVNTSIIFDLENNNGETILRFKHKNWKEATDFYAHCNFQWGKYLISLKNYCETGTGSPFIPNS